MKKIKLIMAVFAFFAFSAFANAQTRNVTLTDDGAVLVSVEAPLQSTYTLDASSFNFKSEADAIAYFADKQSEFVSYRPVLQNNVIMVYLQTKSKPDWSKSDWNAYLAQNKIKDEAIAPSKQISK